MRREDVNLDKVKGEVSVGNGVKSDDLGIIDMYTVDDIDVKYSSSVEIDLGNRESNVVRLKDINEEEFNEGLVEFLVKSRETDISNSSSEYVKVVAVDGDRQITLTSFKKEILKAEILPGHVYIANVKVNVKGSSRYFNIKSIKKSNSDFRDFLYEEFDEDVIRKIKKELTNIINSVKNTTYRGVLRYIFELYHEEFTKCSAAVNKHHANRHGLLVHTYEVVKIAMSLADLYNDLYDENFIDRDLLITGALLHDIGKIEELSFSENTYYSEYSPKSALINHSIIIILRIHEYIAKHRESVNIIGNQMNKEDEDILLLIHLIASHHGKPEYNSLMRPSIPEAYVLHIADKSSAKLNQYKKILDGLEPGETGSLRENNGNYYRIPVYNRMYMEDDNRDDSKDS